MLKGIKGDLENKRFYEAYQKYLHFVNKTVQHNLFDKTALVAVTGIKTLLKYEQVELGKELSLELVKAFNKQDNMSYKFNQYQMTALELLEEVVKLFKDHTTERAVILFESLTLWKDKTDGGHPKLKFLLAQTLHVAKKYDLSHSYFKCFAGHEEEHAKVVFEWSKEGYDWEIEYFFAKAVLQKLREKNDVASSKKLLNELLKIYKETTKKEITPLLRFLTFMITSLEKKKPRLLEYVFHNYKKFIEVDDIFLKYLSKIFEKNFPGESNFVETNSQTNSLAGMFSMLPQLLGSLGQSQQQENQENQEK